MKETAIENPEIKLISGLDNSIIDKNILDALYSLVQEDDCLSFLVDGSKIFVTYNDGKADSFVLNVCSNEIQVNINFNEKDALWRLMDLSEKIGCITFSYPLGILTRSNKFL